MNERLYEELSYVVPLGIPHSRFKSWHEDDQDKALAYRQEMRKVCSGCGTRREEWLEDPDVYVGHIEQCPGCQRMEEEQSNIPENTKGARVYLIPLEVARALMDEGIGVGV